jgi:hypothetical protein
MGQFRSAQITKKVYEVDHLLCPMCQGIMEIICFIEDLDIIEKILRHLNLWDIRNHDPPAKQQAYIELLQYLYFPFFSARLGSYFRFSITFHTFLV